MDILTSNHPGRVQSLYGEIRLCLRLCSSIMQVHIVGFHHHRIIVKMQMLIVLCIETMPPHKGKEKWWVILHPYSIPVQPIHDAYRLGPRLTIESLQSVLTPGYGESFTPLVPTMDGLRVSVVGQRILAALPSNTRLFYSTENPIYQSGVKQSEGINPHPNGIAK